MSTINAHLVAPVGVGESPASLCSRTAYTCRRSVSDFCLDMGMTFQRVVNGEAVAIKKLADLCGADSAELSRNVAVRFDRKNFQWNGHPIHLAGIDRLKVRVCAYCLSEDVLDGNVPLSVRPYARAIWALSGIRTCKKHSAALVPISSNKQFGVSQDFVAVVSPWLTELDKLMLASQEQRFSPTEEYLLSRLAGTTTSEHWLDGVRADAATRICELVGVAATRGARGSVRTLTEAEQHAGAQLGFQILLSDSGLTDLCDELKDECFRKNLYPTGLNVFGFIWRRYYNKSENDGMEPFYSRLRHYAVENLPLGSGDEMFGAVTTSRKWHTIRTAAAEFDLSHALTKKLALSLELAGETARVDQNTFIIDANKFTQYIGQVRGALTKREAMAYLGLPRPHDQGMMKEGYLVPLVRRGDALGHHLFEKTVLDEFLYNLLRDASPAHEIEEGFCNIPNAAYQAVTTVVDIVRLLFARKLKNVFRLENLPGFSSVLVNPAEIVAIVHETESRGFTALELNTKLGANSVSVRALIKHGYLPSSLHKNLKTGCIRPLVSTRDLEDFQRKYIGSFELGLLLRMRAKDVVEKCSIHKIEPAFDPEIVKSRYYVRSEVPWI